MVLLLFIFYGYLKANTDFQHYLNWLSEPLRYLSGNTLIDDSGSLSGLSNMWSSFELPIKEWVVGSGKWTTADGNYYMTVDSGFLRNLAFGGVAFCVYLYIGISLFIFRLSKSINKNFLGWSLVFGAYFVMAEYKGNVSFYFLKLMIPFFLFIKYELNEMISTNKNVIRKCQ